VCSSDLFNTSLGIPYKQEVLVKAPKWTLLRALFAEVTRRVPLVEAVHSIQLGFDATKRILVVTALATVDGEQVTLTTDLLVAPGAGGPGALTP
jgi:hypothetical protein